MKVTAACSEVYEEITEGALNLHLNIKQRGRERVSNIQGAISQSILEQLNYLPNGLA